MIWAEWVAVGDRLERMLDAVQFGFVQSEGVAKGMDWIGMGGVGLGWTEMD